MAKIIGWVMLGVAALCAWIAGYRMYLISGMTEAWALRSTVGFELLLTILCGVVIPLGFGALLLRKPPKD